MPAARRLGAILSSKTALVARFFVHDMRKSQIFQEESWCTSAESSNSAFVCGFLTHLLPKEDLSMATKPAAQATVTVKHLAAKIAETQEMSKKQTEGILGDLVGLITKHLKKGDRIRIGGLGIFVVRKRAARMGRNPATGEAIQIKASKKVAFRAAKDLKEAV
jgi:DNA-binding protein HU-beta